MTFALPVLMGYSLVGELAHEIVGITMGVCFITHNVLNRKWWSGIFKGRYTARRIITTTVNVLLVICVLGSMISAVFISKHIFRFLGIHIAANQMRTIHLLAAYWGFVLMSFHAGTHGGRMFSKVKKKPVKITVYIILAAVSAYGVYAFVQHKFHEYLFLKTAFVFFDTNKPFIFFYLDYLAVMLLFMVLGYYTMKLLSKRKDKV